MADQKTRVVAVGEVMIEMTRSNDGRFNTGLRRRHLQHRGLSRARRHRRGLCHRARRRPLLRRHRLDGRGRRHQDRPDAARARPPARPLHDRDRQEGRASVSTIGASESPARELFELPDWNRVAESMMGARLIFFSGITLSLYSNTGLGRLLAVIEMARQQGVKVAFDGNFRPQGWKGDLPRTRTVFMEALKRVDVALPTFDDEAVLWGDPSPGGDGRAAASVRCRRDRGEERTQQRARFGERSAGVRPAGRGRGPDRHHRGGRQLQRRLHRGASVGENPAAAAAAGHRLAAEKVRHRGAIMPRNAAAVH